ncbi:PREDICTED: heat shock transcription factor, Y-linked-like, partial [Nestor notabilis]
ATVFQHHYNITTVQNGHPSDMWEHPLVPTVSLCFPQKLWKILESDQFRSIWWSEGGQCVAINEVLFSEEVLGRVFATQKMGSFIRQLNIYGFTKVQPDFQRSASLPEFLAEEAAASSHSKVQYYYNPSFNREHPQLLEQCKRRVDIKWKAPPHAKRRAEAPPGPSTAHPS